MEKKILPLIYTDQEIAVIAEIGKAKAYR